MREIGTEGRRKQVTRTGERGKEKGIKEETEEATRKK